MELTVIYFKLIGEFSKIYILGNFLYFEAITNMTVGYDRQKAATGFCMFNIHNIMEEQVESRVNQLYDHVKGQKASWLDCDCENCRKDTICYVLNRIPPRYILSGRGVTHASTVLNDSQLLADIDRLAYEGMKMVNSLQRPYHKSAAANSSKNQESASNIPMFVFPTFIGNVYDGSSFEPLSNASVILKEGKIPAEMMDASWPNPCSTYDATKGGYSFWVAPEVAEEAKVNKEFSFTLEVSAEGYVPVTYSFDVPLTSEVNNRNELNSTSSLKIKDLFLFRSDIKNELE